MHIFERKGHSIRAISRRDLCLLSNVIKPDGTRVVVLKEPKKTLGISNSIASFPKCMTRLLKIIPKLVRSSFMEEQLPSVGGLYE